MRNIIHRNLLLYMGSSFEETFEIYPANILNYEEIFAKIEFSERDGSDRIQKTSFTCDFDTYTNEITIRLSAEQTEILIEGQHKYDVLATVGDEIFTMAKGDVRVVKNIT